MYLIAITKASIESSKAVKSGNWKVMMYSVALFFISNLILFCVYLPTLIYNPEINWRLKGETEQDPMILQAYIPPVLFAFAFLVIVLVTIITKAISTVKNK